MLPHKKTRLMGCSELNSFLVCVAYLFARSACCYKGNKKNKQTTASHSVQTYHTIQTQIVGFIMDVEWSTGAAGSVAIAGLQGLRVDPELRSVWVSSGSSSFFQLSINMPVDRLHTL